MSNLMWSMFQLDNMTKSNIIQLMINRNYTFSLNKDQLSNEKKSKLMASLIKLECKINTEYLEMKLLDLDKQIDIMVEGNLLLLCNKGKFKTFKSDNLQTKELIFFLMKYIYNNGYGVICKFNITSNLLYDKQQHTITGYNLSQHISYNILFKKWIIKTNNIFKNSQNDNNNSAICINKIFKAEKKAVAISFNEVDKLLLLNLNNMFIENIIDCKMKKDIVHRETIEYIYFNNSLHRFINFTHWIYDIAVNNVSRLKMYYESNCDKRQIFHLEKRKLILFFIYNIDYNYNYLMYYDLVQQQWSSLIRITDKFKITFIKILPICNEQKLLCFDLFNNVYIMNIDKFDVNHLVLKKFKDFDLNINFQHFFKFDINMFVINAHDIIVDGFIRSLWQTLEFGELSFPPRYLIDIIKSKYKYEHLYMFIRDFSIIIKLTFFKSELY